MFDSLKEKLSSWIKKSKEKIEETLSKESKEEIEEVKKEKKKLKVELKKKTKTKEAEKISQEPQKIIEETEQEKEEILEIEEPSEEPEEKESFFSKLKSKFAYKITKEDFDNIFDDLEMLLLENNVAVEVMEDIKKRLSQKLIGKEIQKHVLEYEIRQGLKNTLNEILIEPDNPLDAIKLKKEKPFVILFFGINGTGKTTSIAKLAYLLKKNNFSVALAAADTFRAASIEQIAEHAEKLNVPLIKQDYGSDPAAVGFDAIKYAKKHKIDIVLIDTAGRMHTKTNLLNEMEKICRVTNPDLKIFIAESIAGNDATEQAKTFNELVGIDGSILSKADVDEKGGTIISVSHATHKPIFYLGTGQKYQDLEFFDKKKFIDKIGLY